MSRRISAIKPENNLAGMQLGLQSIRGWERFQVVTEGKAGVFANFYTQQKTDTASGPAQYLTDFAPVDESQHGTDVAAMFELSIMARFRCTDHLWLRLGYQVYCVTGLALGPAQLNGYTHNSTVALDGLSAGVDMAW